jgi:copper resistance protein C
MPRRPRQPRRRLPRSALWVGALLAAGWVVLLPLPAQAHAALVSSSPSDGDVVAGAPAEVSFTFDEDVVAPAFVSVIAPDGSNVAQGEAVIDGPTVTQAVRLVPEQGAYSAGYRVVSDDGHPVTGTIHFTVDPKHATSMPTAPVCADDCGPADSGTGLWHRESTWVVVALSALAVGIALVVVFGMRSGAAPPGPGDDG